MWNPFRRKKTPAVPPPADFSFLGVDFHSHLIPGVDDGSPDLETSVAHIRGLQALGYRALVTTPHVHGDFYRNTKETIQAGTAALKAALKDAGITLPIDAAAEYYLDDYFLRDVLPQGLLTFGNNQVLVEVSMAGWPRNFDDLLFAVQAAGYNVVLAHPERYTVTGDPVVLFRSIKDRGVALQMNLLAPLGYYGGSVRETALRLLDARLYDYAATDLHHERHLKTLQRLLIEQPQLAARLASYPFRNTELIPEGSV